MDQQVRDAGAVRDADQHGSDGEAVRRQAAALSPGRRAAYLTDRVTALVLARRAGAPVEGPGAVEPVDLVREDRPDAVPGGVPVVRGTLLVRAALARQDPVLHAALVAEVGPAVARLDDRLHVLTGVLPARRLVELARTVRAAGFEASVDHVVPLGIVIKGEGGPARTVVRLEQDPEPQVGGVVVGVVDTGAAPVGRHHEWQRDTPAVEDTDPLDAFPIPGGDGRLDAAAGHGAFAAGVVQQRDPGGTLVLRRAVDSDGVGSEVRVAEALLQVVRKDGAEVVNLSLGAQTVDDQPLLALQVAFELLREGCHEEVLLVAAAGNFGGTRPCWPAASKRVVAVGGLTAGLRASTWSSRGPWVDVSVVGEGVVSTYVRGAEDPALAPGSGPDDWPLDDPRPWAVWTGTSFAAPQVSGEVARRLAERRVGGDTAATPRSVLAGLLGEGTPLAGFGIALRLLDGTSA